MNQLARRITKTAAGSALVLASIFGLAACGKSSNTPANTGPANNGSVTNSTPTTVSTPTTQSSSGGGGFVY